MRDEMDGRIWVGNHQGFSDGIDDLVTRLGAAFKGLGGLDGPAPRLLALVMAFLVTVLTFNTTTA